jgi:Arc/MetJ-type ribon-helix-helix transcriptional regulator
MPTNEPITITLPADMSERIRKRIAENGYSDPVQVIGHSLDALESEDSELPEWMVRDILEPCDELDRDPTQVMTMEECGEALQKEYARAPKAG